MTTLLTVLLALALVASIILILIQRGTIQMQRTSLQIQRIQTDSALEQAARWRDEAMQLRRKHAKPEKRDTRPIREDRPARTPLQDKLDSMVNAVASKRLSPVRHAPNIQPRRTDNHPSTDTDFTSSLIAGTVIGATFSADTSTPDSTSYSATDSGSFGGGDSGSFPTDSGSFGGGDSGSF